jgi:hypothetical protein
MHKYWFKLQNLKIKDKMDNYIFIALSESDQDKQFCNYIDLIMNCLRNKFKKKKINSNIIKNNHNILQINISNFNIFDSNNNKLTINDINKLDSIDIIIELNEIKVYNNQMYLIWNILQMKKLPLIDFNTNFFTNNIIKSQKTESPIIIKGPEVSKTDAKIDFNPILPEIKKNIQIDKPSINLSGAIITPQLLLTQLNKLKKQPQQIINDKNILETVEKNPVNQVKLKKVETKGPLSGIETFNLIMNQNNIQTNNDINIEDIIKKVNNTLIKQNEIKYKNNKKYKSLIKKWKKLDFYYF